MSYPFFWWEISETTFYMIVMITCTVMYLGAAILPWVLPKHWLYKDYK